MISGSEFNVLVPTAPAPSSTAAPAPTLMSVVDVIKEESAAVTSPETQNVIAPPPETSPDSASINIDNQGTPSTAIQVIPPPPADAEPGEVGSTPPADTVTGGTNTDTSNEDTGGGSGFSIVPITEGTDTSGLTDIDNNTDTNGGDGTGGDIGGTSGGSGDGDDGVLPPPPDDEGTPGGMLGGMDKKDMGFIMAGVSAGLIMLGSFLYFFIRARKKK